MTTAEIAAIIVRFNLWPYYALPPGHVEAIPKGRQN